MTSEKSPPSPSPAQGQASGQPISQPVTQTVTQRLHRIMVVDDDPDALRLVEAILRQSELDVVTHLRAADALIQLESERFDCLVTDAIMPELDGYDFTKKVRAIPRLQFLPIIMLTKRRERDDVRRAVEVGITETIFKPLDPPLLVAKIQEALNKSGNIEQAPATCSVTPQHWESAAESTLSLKILNIFPNEVVLQSDWAPARIDPTPIRLTGPIFRRIGLNPPELFVTLRQVEAIQQESDGQPIAYRLTATYSDLSEPQYQKLIDWLQVQT